MKPEIFMDDFERTHYGDSVYSSIGRALTISTRFENNCKMLALILNLKGKPLLENKEEFNALVNKLYNKGLFDNINIILKHSKDFNKILNMARESRNEIVHELTKGLDRKIDLLIENERENFDSILIELIGNISHGDLVTSLLLSRITKEPILNTQFLNNYRNNILEWVMRRSE